ncbi:3-hydroxy-9,10-secoandrosta-1,3,5(10)-triene-9,17-dione monooxygenase oxygenase subunit [Streptomyces sp. NBC_01190]|uniref:3-hydroxy-9,10-secoandrosta-1,3,5(10)-triene-9, 17-dione monooxygenase oxygenase subunit n=1 Tax=Streptomyces sp. NBC_01190 TaxID=2903767 RepID=UPI0038687A7B|nr:acyl-CoA dehydrogenase family protein [Streptomyces sp. NBC_01190]
MECDEIEQGPQRAVLEAVRDLAPGLRARAEESERTCRLPKVSVKELRETGFFRLLTPRTYGGLAADPRAHFTAVTSLAAACGSTGWVASVFGVHLWHVALFDPRAQREVWGDDPEALVCSSYAPAATTAEAPGGYTLSGRWSFSSGSGHASWVLLGALVPGGEGASPGMRALLLPRSDVRVEEHWETVGLRGTGSNDIVVEEVFVPAHRTIEVGVSERSFPGWEANPEPLYRMPFPAMFTTAVAAPSVGIAEAAYRDHCDTLRGRIAAGRPRRGDLETAGQLRIARGASDIDASWRQLVGNIGELYGCVVRGGVPSLASRARVRRDQVLATVRAMEAVDLLMAHAGGNAMRTGSGPLQRAWRDIHTARGHAANDVERGLLPSAQESLGIEVRETMV